MTGSPSPTEFVGDVVRMAIKRRVPAVHLANMHVSSWTDHLTDDLVVKLELGLRAIGKQQVPVTFQVPADWWQAFREQVFYRFRVGRWWLRRHPVRHRTIVQHVDQFLSVCPHEILPPSGEPGHHVARWAVWVTESHR